MHSVFLGHLVVILLIVITILVVFAKMNLPSVLGYLISGLIMGPDVLGIISNEEEAALLSETGIMLMMFMIGLDFSWSKLRRNLKMVIHVGFACTAAIMAVVILFAMGAWGTAFPAAFLIGGAVAMSSTAVVSKQLMDQREFYDSHGRIAFGVTLFQDFTAIMIIASIPALAHPGEAQAMALELATAAGSVAAVLAIIYFIGRKVELSLMRFIGALKSNEIFILCTLLTILCAAWLSDFFHLPTLLGVFIAGMIIGETEFKHKVEDDIRPFHDIMIGVFFIVMGMMLKPSEIAANLPVMLGLLTGLIFLKFAIMALITSVYSKNVGSGLRTGMVLANCDEFSLILVVLGVQNGIIETGLGNLLLTVFILSLMFSTLIIAHNKKASFFLLSVFGLKETPPRELPEDGETRNISNHIILCGCGETGRNLCNILKNTHIPVVAIDNDPRKVERAFFLPCHAIYGDATNLKILKSANIGQAHALVITFDNHVQAIKLLQKVRHEHPDLPVIVRVHEIDHIEDMLSLGATAVFSDGIGISLSMRREIMKALNLPEEAVPDEDALIKEAFRS